MVDLLEIFVPRGTEFFGESAGNFRSPGNEISRWICWKFSFPGEQNFSVNQPGNFRSPGNEISRWICWNFSFPGERFSVESAGNQFSFPGERNFTVDKLEIFVPQGTEFFG